MVEMSHGNETSAADKQSANWNFTPAPRSAKARVTRRVKDRFQTVEVVIDLWVIAALPGCAKVGKTRWLPDEGRWEGMAKGQEPAAWMLWPDHPLAERSDAAQ